MTDLKPGPEMDALVAEALGWRKDVWPVISISPRWVRPGVVNVTLNDLEFSPPPFSTDPGEAIKALEEFAKKPKPGYSGGSYIWAMRYSTYTTNKYRIVLYPIGEITSGFEAVAKTLEHAICLAIVEAAGGER